MKRFLSFLILALLPGVVFGASPVLENFAPTDFTTNNPTPGIIRVNIDTNQFTRIPRIRLTNITSITGSTIWTNDNTIYRPLQLQNGMEITNIVSDETLTANGAFILGVGMSTNLVMGLNDLNPYKIGYIRAVGPTTTPTDANISLSAGSGGILFIENYSSGSAFSITNNTPRWDDAGKNILLSNGDWLPTRQGETLMLWLDSHGDWIELGRANASTNSGSPLWQVVGGVLEPIDLTLPVMITNRLQFNVANTLNLHTVSGEPAFESTLAHFNLNIIGSGGSPAYYGINSGIDGDEASVQGPTGVALGWSVGLIEFARTNIYPSSPINIGTAGNPFGSVALIGGSRITPFKPDGTTPHVLDTTITHTTGNLLEAANNGTNQFFIAAITDIGAGDGALAFMSDGKFHTPAGGGTTINPTDNVMPYRVNATSFGDSPWFRFTTNQMGFGPYDVASPFMQRWGGLTGDESWGIGESALGSGGSLISYGNIALGKRALQNIRGGIYNLGYGSAALQHVNTGNYNTGIGASAGNALTTDDKNTLIGAFAWTGRFGSNNISIGYLSNDALTDTVSNTITIGTFVTGASPFAGSRATNSGDIILGNRFNSRFLVPGVTGWDGSGTHFASDDGTFKSPSGTFANPTATIGNSAVNGSASTAMRSDGAPALPTTLQHYNGTDTNALLSAMGGAPLASPVFTGTALAPAMQISSLIIGSMGIGTRSTLTETGGSVICDLSLTNRYWTCSPTGNVTVAVINPTAGNWGNLLLRWPSTNCQFTIAWSSSSSTTNWLSGAPSTNATANTIGFLGIYPQDATTNSTIAGYSATQ